MTDKRKAKGDAARAEGGAAPANDDAASPLSEEELRALRAARRELRLDAPLDLRTRVREDKRRKRRDAPKHKGRAHDGDDADRGGNDG